MRIKSPDQTCSRAIDFADLSERGSNENNLKKDPFIALAKCFSLYTIAHYIFRMIEYVVFTCMNTFNERIEFFLLMFRNLYVIKYFE